MTKDLDGKVFLVTGGTEGIGKAAAQRFAELGATLVLVGRNRDKSERVAAEIAKTSGNDRVSLLLGDMSKIADIRAVAAEFREKHDRLDVLVNNAGAVFTEYRTSADGFEMTFALNHIGYFVLTTELLDLLKKMPGSRIVSTSSAAHQAGKIDLATVAVRDGKSAGFSAYGDSKLANILFTRELARRIGAAGPTAHSVNPRFVQTGFGLNNEGIIRYLVKAAASLFARSPAKGAETLVWLATSPEAAKFNGEYFFDCKVMKTTRRAKDAELAEGLWELSEKLCAGK
jgi:NAD(P)-dependent dehydrogenase (short-subunit alcohol dehydrogenase family)